VCARERTRSSILKFYDIFDTRAVIIYWMTDTNRGDHRWDPIMTSRVACSPTFLREGRRDWIECYSSCVTLNIFAGAQYQWNASTPGAHYWPGDLDIDRDGTAPAVFFDEWLPKFAEEMFGPKAGSDMEDLFRGALSPVYMVLPDVVSAAALIPNTTSRMEQQTAGMRKAAAGIDRVWRRLEAGEKDVLRPGSEPYFYGLSEQAGRALAYGSWHLARMRAEQALRRGADPAEAAAILRKDIEQLKIDQDLARRMDRRTDGKPLAGKANMHRWAKAIIQPLYRNPDYADRLAELERLEMALGKGEMIELRESEAGVRSVRWLIQDGQNARIESLGEASAAFVDYPTQRDSDRSLLIEGLSERARGDGCLVTFDPVDVSGYLEKEGRLRFYVNGGAEGGHDINIALVSDGPGEERETSSVNLSEFLSVDGLEATWQLADVPLEDVLPAGQNLISGVRFRQAHRWQRSGPLWIDSVYVCLPGDPVETKVAIQSPPERPAATTAEIRPVILREDRFVGGEGTESRVETRLKLTADGSLTDASVYLRILSEDGKPLAQETIYRAKRLNAPWWSPEMRFDLGCEIGKGVLQMTLRSGEIDQTFSRELSW
jgi:hypothetical protein